MDTNDFFNDAMTDAPDLSQITEDRKANSIGHGSLVMLGIVDITPSKKEREAAMDTLKEDPTVDIKRIVPWYDGITLNLVAITSRPFESKPEDPAVVHVSIDENGMVSYPHGTVGITFNHMLNIGQVEKGFLEMINADGRTVKAYLPANWGNISPIQRFGTWITWAAGQLRIPREMVRPGTLFVNYVTKRKVEKKDRTTGEKIPDAKPDWYTDIRPVFKDAKTQATFEADTRPQAWDANTLASIYRQIRELNAAAKAAREGTTPAPGGAYGFDDKPPF